MLLRRSVSRIDIGMEPTREPPVRTLDVVKRGFPFDSEQDVQVHCLEPYLSSTTSASMTSPFFVDPLAAPPASPPGGWLGPPPAPAEELACWYRLAAALCCA